jgi:hypothetical protein
MQTAASQKRPGSGLTVKLLLLHGLAAWILWCALFISKWFPYGYLLKAREWLYRYF